MAEQVVVFDGATVEGEEIVQVIPGVGEQAEVECGTTVLSRSDDGRITVGIWRCEPTDGWLPMEMGARGEYFQVLEGSMVLREQGGEPVEAGPGMSVYSPPGWVGEWRVPDRLRKTFVSIEIA
jgi:uncharacterized cupin superfamily protein